jgi:hypothetical protein
VLGDEAVGGEEIAEQYDEVAFERVAGIDHLAHAGKPHIGTAGMQVGDDADGEATARRPARRIEPVMGDD